MKKRKGKVLLITIIILYAVICAALYVYAYVVPKISGALIKTETVNYDTLEIYDEVDCLFVRTEEVTNAKQAGNISYYAEETEKTRKDTKVLDVYPNGKNGEAYYCGKTGIVSYYIDGSEAQLYPEMLSDMTLSEFEALDITPENVKRDTAEAGQPLFKVVTSDTWYIVFPVPMEKLDNYKEGSSVTLVFEDGEVKATVDDIIGTEDTKLISCLCRKYYENFAQIRQTKAKIITSSFEGLSVPCTAVTYEKGQSGVYIKNINNEYDFVPVNILASDEEKTIITEGSFTVKNADGSEKKINSVKLYDEVLKDAKDIKNSPK